MSRKRTSPPNTRDQAVLIKEAWENIGGGETIGGVTLPQVETALGEFDAVERTIIDLQDQLTSARNQRKDRRYELWTLVKRARIGAKAQYGDDSDEYERFGGTRISEQ